MIIKHKSKITFQDREISKTNLNYLKRFRKSLKARNRKDSTIYNYIKDIEQFLQYIQKDIIDINQSDLENYLIEMKRMGNSYNRILRRYRVLSSFYSFLKNRKLISEDITLNIKIIEYK